MPQFIPTSQAISNDVSQINQLKSECSALQAQIAKTPSVTALTTQDAAVRKQIGQLQSQLSQQSTINQENQQLQLQLQQAQQQQQQYQTQLTQAQSQLATAKSQNTSLVSQLKTKAQQHNFKVEPYTYSGANGAVALVPNGPQPGVTSAQANHASITPQQPQGLIPQNAVKWNPAWGDPTGFQSQATTPSGATYVWDPTSSTHGYAQGGNPYAPKGHYVTQQVQTGTRQECTTQKVPVNHATYHATFYPWKDVNGHITDAHYGPPGSYGAPYWTTYEDKQVCKTVPVYTTKQVWVNG